LKLVALVTLALAVIAVHPLAAQPPEDLEFHFGWVLEDGTIFVEIPQVYDDDDFEERFSSLIEPIPFNDPQSILMCQYRTPDNPDKINLPPPTKDSVLVLVDGTLRRGISLGMVYVRDQVVGYHLPGGHIRLDNASGLPSCNQEDCSFYCVPALIMSDCYYEHSVSNAVKIHDLEDPEPIPKHLRAFADSITLPRSNAELDQCWNSFFRFNENGEHFIIERSCIYRDLNANSKYYLAKKDSAGQFNFIQLAHEDTTYASSMGFLSFFQIDGAKYVFALDFGYETNCMALYSLFDDSLILDKTSHIFGF